MDTLEVVVDEDVAVDVWPLADVVLVAESFEHDSDMILNMKTNNKNRMRSTKRFMASSVPINITAYMIFSDLVSLFLGEITHDGWFQCLSLVSYTRTIDMTIIIHYFRYSSQ